MTSRLPFAEAVIGTSSFPPSLKAEHLELSLKLNMLRAELSDVKARLGAGHRWFGLL